MNPAISALTHTARCIQHAVNRLAARLTRKASIKFSLTASLPPFIKIGFVDKADIGKAANNNQPRHKPPRTA